jgi:hypothetical protein
MNFTGTWDVVSSPDFDDDYLRMEVTPHVRLRSGLSCICLHSVLLWGWINRGRISNIWRQISPRFL